MKKLSALLLVSLSFILTQPAAAQPVPRTSVVEHFTNTWCSVCFSRNPGFYNNLVNFPQVLHIAYYPSSPYSGCPFNQLNRVENDARTNFYGVYGGTPRFVFNGVSVPTSTDYTNPSLFQNGLSQTSDYTITVAVRRVNDTTGNATIVVKKVAPNALTNLMLYAVVAEDTVVFSAKNGENIHYNLFHQSLTGAQPQTLSGLPAVGDSLSRTFSFAMGRGWGRTRVTAMLQDGAKNGLQAARSAPVPTAASTGVPTLPCAVPMCMFPIPVIDDLHFKALPAGYHNYTILNSVGQVVLRGTVYDVAVPISLRSLPGGFYHIAVGEGSQMQRGTFVKQ